MSSQAEAMMQHQIEGAISENESLRQENERLRTALRVAREGYASEALTGLPVLPQWRERTVALIDAAIAP